MDAGALHSSVKKARDGQSKPQCQSVVAEQRGCCTSIAKSAL